jgi:Phosphotransferase enzyme family
VLRTAATPRQADDEALRRGAERLVAEEYGGREAVAGIERERSDHSSSYPADVVTVRLAGGAAFRLFLKDFGSSELPKDEPGRQRDRELRVYRELLAGAGLGTARYLGSVRDDPQGRFWLLLEFVGGTPLAYCEFEHWVEAAGRLGRLHGHFAGQAERLRSCDFLARHDADFFRSKARLALDAVAAVAPALAGRMDRVLSGYDRCVAVMVGQPPTLVHGAYKPRHILVDLGSRPRRVCPVDWELTALGSGFYDLAFLAYGFEPPSLDCLLEAYRGEARAHGLPLPDRDGMRHVVDCFRLHRVLKALAGARVRNLPAGGVAKLVESAERLSAIVC